MTQNDSEKIASEQHTTEKTAFTDVFITRPVIAVVLSMVLVLLGLVAAFKLPVLQYPKIDSSSLIITTAYTGASAADVQGFVTEPIERVAASVPGVDYVDSLSRAGLSTVTLWLDLNQSSTDAMAELSTRLSQIRFELPANAEDPAVEVRRADRPAATFYLDVMSETYSRAQLTDFLTRQINPTLATIDGVQKIGLEGSREPAMRIWLDPQRLASFNLSAADVWDALARNNITATIGRSENDQQRIDLVADTLMQSPADFERLVVKSEGKTQIRLEDVARIKLGENEGDINARRDDNSAVYISVWPLPGANEIAIGDTLYTLLDELNPTLPADVKIGISYDGTLYMRNALKEIFTTLIETVILVGLVVLALMGSMRSALVPLITIPISLLGAVAMMAAMGFSLNLLTILAIVLAVGLVVDDAIVVVENVARHMREGMSRTQAALASSRQLLAPIIAMTITLAAVYAPIGMLSGLTGLLFKEFAFTLAVAVLISGVVALTLSPIMSASLSQEGGKESKGTRWVNDRFKRLEDAYRNSLNTAFAWRAQILTLGAIVSLLAAPFYVLSQKELAPTEDQAAVSIIMESPPESSLAYTTEQVHDVVSALSDTASADYFWQILTPSGGFGGVELVPFNDRDESVHDLVGPFFGKLSQVTGIKAFPILPAALPTAGNFDVELVVISADAPEQMAGYASQLVGAAYGSGKFMFAETDLKLDLPQARFKLNRERIADLGMTMDEVNRQLMVLSSGNYVNRFNLGGKGYRVIPMVEGLDRADPASLMKHQLITPDGNRIPLSAIATLEEITVPRVLTRFEQRNSFKIYGGVIPGVTKAQGLAALEAAAVEILPRGYQLDHSGESRQIKKEGSTLVAVLGVALAFVYFVLAVQFHSFRDPLVILLGSVPLALSGALVFPYLSMTTINIYSQIGFITLVGLIAKNGILIVEFANHLQEQGLRKAEAAREAAVTRLRPILMTTAATVLGHFPLVLVTGAGAEARNSIGIILVAGMLIGTLFTLYILPNVYALIAAEKQPQAIE
ncbi:Efflux pump membrane transporter BepE [BD1-7 clade bacterium]|uniref:Efflux pump membrane transporter BepE n=1 Tax=BD1-7 clade bacterium TaxID=2029982 RepID=A0A5S9PZR6_9GAMM|nr:Efflux pump membrane transporter BepE [BD1-7 clade bacterium]CAA0112786.1 Efflux pump membrane transporter BepE [BD1-7 clade bacterium]